MRRNTCVHVTFGLKARAMVFTLILGRFSTIGPHFTLRALRSFHFLPDFRVLSFSKLASKSAFM